MSKTNDSFTACSEHNQVEQKRKEKPTLRIENETRSKIKAKRECDLFETSGSCDLF